MYYVCIEDNKIVSILNYSPNVPNSVAVYEITNEQADQITAQTHYYDIPTKSVQEVDSSITAQKAQETANAEYREFLRSTDWKILRHIRQKALNVPTSLTEEEYLTLEQQRADAADNIV